jgi:hypothetical protein
MKPLKEEPIPWLLEPDPQNPGVRYFTLTDLLDRPVDDSEVQDARAAIAQQPLVQALFASQHPNGHWDDDEAKPYRSEGAYGVLAILAQLGVEPDERTALGCENILRYSQNECGGFSMTQTRKSGIFPCTTPDALLLLVYFGYGDDPRVRKAFDYMIKETLGQKPLDCGRYQHRDCLWGAMQMLHALALLPDDMRSQQSKRAICYLADALLDYRYDFAGEEKIWLKFSVPRYYDLLYALDALARHGYSKDPRFAPLIEIFLAQQDDNGRWLKGRGSRTYPLEKTGQPSKWITLKALRVLKRVYR